ncbi:ABC transporter related protein [Emticicia oligotrophica DSM 17448]|uniref:ABC transporter related protein n=1 Tax=Emticicia oligotrophica (strain DSM 17448 / CIP 109782 / MTCC 6937 / GPTSA100-15) TaxID=929562 RepID=A0ABM5MY95_EMTOG|nr:ABC transporter ATP-binding protein [Emticicia oligotrophica]AFK02123.1 ABC transporter related protein [Emticicia oligotrophica DSM 17448]
MNVIRIENLQKSYGSGLVLKDINLEVNSGEIIGYIGPNGAGKSTTIKILIGMIPDFDGKVEVLGHDVKSNSLEVKRLIGYVPENASLYDTLSPMEYLRFLGSLYELEMNQIEEKATELLRLFALYDQRDDRMTTFSKGMKQKVLLISGILQNPEIIFLDEPLSGLDANAVILVKEILSQLKQAGKTIFYSSHIMDVVEKISDRIVLINKGTVIANGTFEELKAQRETGSLEQIFNQLTGNTEHVHLAEEFIQIMNR